MATPAMHTGNENLSAANMTPHNMINLLLSGALDRIEEAMDQVNQNEIEAAAALVLKTINIVGALRDSLDLEAGGEIAENLDNLYVYINERLSLITTETPIQTLVEVKDLLNQVHAGWMGIEGDVEASVIQGIEEAI